MTNSSTPARLARSWLNTSSMVLLLAVAACGSPSNDLSLFSERSTQVNSGGASATAVIDLRAAGAGTSGSNNTIAIPDGAGTSATSHASAVGGSANGGTANGGTANGGIASGDTANGGTASGGSTNGDTANGGAGLGGGGATSDGASAGSVSPNESGGAANGDTSLAGAASTLNACARYGANAAYDPVTQHCYLAVHDLATFAVARLTCIALGAHLVSIADDAENVFAWSISPAEHWIGANDGKAPTEPGVGRYAWLTGEPFDYAKWTPGQPNASATDCNGNGGAGCYEHCAFQWNGGGWNDRYCQQTIESVCEWERTALP